MATEDGTASDMAAESLRRETEAALSALLARRDPSARLGVLGAGSDDLDSGRDYLAKLSTGGYAVPTWPTDSGGMGLTQAHADVVRTVLAGFEAPDMYPFLVGLDLIGPTVLRHGSEEQKHRWLPPMQSGEEIWCQMFSEPDAGSDLAGLKARAVRDGDGWRVTGSLMSSHETRPTMRSVSFTISSSPSMIDLTQMPLIVPQSSSLMITSCATSWSLRVM